MTALREMMISNKKTTLKRCMSKAIKINREEPLFFFKDSLEEELCRI